MTKPRRLSDRHIAIYVIATQATLAIVIPLLTLLASGSNAATAALAGGCIATIANGYFAIQAFRYSGASTSTRMIQAFYRGEAGKFVIVAVLFVATFRFVDSARQHGLAIILTFAAVQCSAWFVPLFVHKSRGQQ